MRVPPGSPARSLRTRYLIAALVPVLVVVLSITGFVWAQKGVTVVVDGQSRLTTTHADTVSEFLDELEIEVSGADVVTPTKESGLADGDTVVVRHAIPVVLELAGETLELDVIGRTVSDALVAAGADPGSGLQVTPALSAPLEPGMHITAKDVFVRVVQEETAVPFKTVARNDATLDAGLRKVVTAGVDGRMLRVYRLLVVNGQEGARALTSESLAAPPIDEVVAVGTKRSSARIARAARASTPPVGGSRLTVSSTAYSPQEPGIDNRTATGAIARMGVIAVDPAVIPLGTKVFVPGYGYAVAADTGGAIKGNRIDLCFDTVAEALAWGRRTVTITIIE